MTGSAEAVAAAIATEIPNIEDISVNTTAKTISFKVKDEIGTIGNVYGGGDAAAINGNAIVNIGNMATVPIMKHDTNGVPLNANDQPIYDHVTGEPFDDNRSTEIVYNTPDVLGANITGDVYGGGNEANVTGNTYVNISALMTPVNNNYKVDHSNTANFEGLSIGGSVYGGGCKADVLKNTFVRMEDGYVFNGIFGGGYSGSVGSASDEEGSIIYHTGSEAHTGCIGKIIKYKADTGKCTVVVNGGQIGPDEVATQGMNRITNNKLDPIPQGWVWGAGCGIVDNPANDPDMDFRTYVKETDVTIGGTAFIMESVIGGGEFGRVLGDTKVTIEGNCQIGAGYNYLDETSHKPKRYAEELWTP